MIIHAALFADHALVANVIKLFAFPELIAGLTPPSSYLPLQCGEDDEEESRNPSLGSTVPVPIPSLMSCLSEKQQEIFGNRGGMLSFLQRKPHTFLLHKKHIYWAASPTKYAIQVYFSRAIQVTAVRELLSDQERLLRLPDRASPKDLYRFIVRETQQKAAATNFYGSCEKPTIDTWTWAYESSEGLAINAYLNAECDLRNMLYQIYQSSGVSVPDEVVAHWLLKMQHHPLDRTETMRTLYILSTLKNVYEKRRVTEYAAALVGRVEEEPEKLGLSNVHERLLALAISARLCLLRESLEGIHAATRETLLRSVVSPFLLQLSAPFYFTMLSALEKPREVTIVLLRICVVISASYDDDEDWTPHRVEKYVRALWDNHDVKLPLSKNPKVMRAVLHCASIARHNELVNVILQWYIDDMSARPARLAEALLIVSRTFALPLTPAIARRRIEAMVCLVGLSRASLLPHTLATVMAAVARLWGPLLSRDNDTLILWEAFCERALEMVPVLEADAARMMLWALCEARTVVPVLLECLVCRLHGVRALSTAPSGAMVTKALCSL